MTGTLGSGHQLWEGSYKTGGGGGQVQSTKRWGGGGGGGAGGGRCFKNN